VTWEYWLFLVIAAAALGAIFFFTLSQNARRRPPVRHDTAKEPTFAERDNKLKNQDTDKKPPPSPTQTPSEQGTLPIEPFEIPTLPEPTEDMLPADMCYDIRFFGKKPLTASVFSPLLEQLKKNGINVGRLLGFDVAADGWRHTPDMPCPHWIVALPLADRGGAINQATIRLIESIARPFAQKINLHPVFPPAAAAIKNAALIDNFCTTVDMFIELRLVGEPQQHARIDEVMRINGMVKESDRDYLCRVESENLFRAKLMPTPAGGGGWQTLIFELDAPNVCDPSRAYEEMLRRIRRVAQVINMRLTDPKGIDVDDTRIHTMNRQLALLTSQMREFGVEPGGSLARLIFS
jgi:hypothetical protein